jgi:anti-sigma factor RsiW
MNRDSCEEMEELLVDFADGALAGGEAERVGAHLERCPHCRAMVEALAQSLRCAEVIWQDNLRETQAARVGLRRLWRYFAIAAGVALSLGSVLFWSARHQPTTKAPTLAEVERHIVTAGTAARLLAATDQLETQASLRDVAQSQYRYILERYPDTEAAAQARLKLESLR